MIPGLGRGRHVWLVGMPGAGKSVVGPALAERLGMAFVDTDHEVERAAVRSIPDLFEHDGEEAFRALETRALCEASEGAGSVIATGGGAVLAEENRRTMRRTGLVVHLHVDAADAAARLERTRTARPLLADPGAWSRLAAEREPLYAEIADVSISGIRSGEDRPLGPDGIADLLVRAVDGQTELTSTRVETPDGGYDVVVGRGILSGRLRLWTPEAPQGGTAFVVADPAVSTLFLDPVTEALGEAGWGTVHLAVAEGEDAKTLAVAEALYRQLAVREAQRQDLVVALGGGATGDLAGFVAATYLRGIPVLQVPTTLLAMVDAAIGGKTAVNLPAGKNLVGAFHQPVAVVADVVALRTLPEAEFRSGLGEVAKYALAFDRGLIGILGRETGSLAGPDRRQQDELLMDVVRRCVEIKAEVVSKDERDAGDRLFLNYGHTLGHALERLDGFGARSHGEAVAIGMIFAARLAERLGVSGPGLVERHVRLLEPLGLPTGGPLPPAPEVVAAMGMDKKRRGALRFVLLEDVGRPTVATDVPDDILIETLEAM
jgi:3-dehydroquinate synthase